MTNQHPFDGLSDDAVVVRAHEPDDDPEGSFTLARTALALCAPEPLTLMVLIHWRLREQDGQPCTVEAIWATLTEMGVHGAQEETPVSLEETAAAVDFLLGHGLISVPGGAR